MKHSIRSLLATLLGATVATLPTLKAQDVDVTFSTNHKATIIHKDGETEEIEVFEDDGNGKNVQSFLFKSVTVDIWEQIEEQLRDSDLDEEILKKIKKAVAKAAANSGILSSGIIIDADESHEAIKQIKKLSGAHADQWISGLFPFDDYPAPGALHEVFQTPNQSGHMIGVQCTQVSDTMRAQLDIDDGQGLLVQRVFDDTPAKSAGIKKHDILLTANEAALETVQDLIDVVDEVGEESNSVSFTSLRNGENQTVTVNPEKHPKRTKTVAQDLFSEIIQKHNVDDSKIEKLQEQIDSLSSTVAELIEKLEK